MLQAECSVSEEARLLTMNEALRVGPFDSIIEGYH
jgi:hypothetical protein